MTKYQRLLDDLAQTGIGRMKVFGHSMMPKIKSGSVLTFQKQDTYRVVDVVFSKIRGNFIDAHQITKIDSQGRYLISNNKGHDNGWTTLVFGKVIAIEPPR